MRTSTTMHASTYASAVRRHPSWSVVLPAVALLGVLLCGSFAKAGDIVVWGEDDFYGILSGAPAGSDFIAVAMDRDPNNSAAHALTTDGSIVSWGTDAFGQVSNAPTGIGHTAIAAGFRYAVALASDGSIVAWGDDSFGQVSNVPAGTGFTAISAGQATALALKADGSVVAWGSDLSLIVSDAPSISGATEIGCGGAVGAFAVLANGSIFRIGLPPFCIPFPCWDPGPPSGLGFSNLAVGPDFGLALFPDGSIEVWGNDSYGLVSGAPTGSGFTTVVAGDRASIALAADGSLVQWGGFQFMGPPPVGPGYTAMAMDLWHGIAVRGPSILNITTDVSYASVQGALDGAANGEVIELPPGTHVENLDFLGKAVTLRSSSGDPSTTILQGDGLDHVVRCANGEGAGTVLQGLTITGGDSFFGGGLFCGGASPTIVDCVFTANNASGRGGAVYCVNGSSPELTRCTFLGNTALYGAGVYCEQSSSPAITSCRFLGNAATVRGGGLYQAKNANSLVVNCLFSGNTAAITDGAGAMIEMGSSPTFINCTFSGNIVTSPSGTGGAISSDNPDCFPTVSNCVLWGNSPDEFRPNTSGGQLFLSNSDVAGSLPAGVVDVVGNLSEDPLFQDFDGADDIVGTLDDDLRPANASPVSNFGDGAALPADGADLDGDGDVAEALPHDLDGLARTGFCRVDMGAYESVFVAGCWTKTGNGLPGTYGKPLYTGAGTLVGGDIATSTLSNALENSFAGLVIGLSQLNAPFKQGNMVPYPDIIIAGIPTGPNGVISIPDAWPLGVPSGFTIYFQYWVTDPASPAGFAASNGLGATSP